MAAKQGLSAQISQASEDAKRAVLNRTSLTTSLWFSNLNTTCTIKSAPPRTPEVLSLLSTKSGWLFKRNEQHVWQTRWCCVVPHTFMYYFDANVLPGEAQPPGPSPQQQEDWNHAIANGYPHRGNRKQQAPRSSLYLSLGGGGGGGGGGGTTHNNHEDGPSHHHFDRHNHNSNANSLASSPTQAHYPAPPPHRPYANSGSAAEFFASMQPAGIIDLECYSAVHRSQQNQLVLELAGDDTVNPDLRQFYFSTGSEVDTEEWTKALLGQRHTALMDETEAYKQVCEGFAHQLQLLHVEMDRAQKQAEDAQEELYQVRSEMEDGRRQCWKLVEEVLDRHYHQQQQQHAASSTEGGSTNNVFPAIHNSQSFRTELNTIRSQDISLLAPVQLLGDYTRVLEDSCNELQASNLQLQQSLEAANDSDHDQVQQLQRQLEETNAEMARQQSQWLHDKQVLQQKLDASQKELEDLNKDLASTRMEITMYQSSTRNKIVELQNHKKILKKEVLDLRQKLEDTLSDLSLVKHKEKSHRLEVDQERKKAELLERYVDKMESQVKVQQNMMEMMSASGVGSVHGGIVGGAGGGGVGGSGSGSHYEVTVPHTVHSPRSNNSSSYNNNINNATTQSPSRRNILLVNTGAVGADAKDVVHIHDADAAGIQMPNDGNNGGTGDDDDDDDGFRHQMQMHHHHPIHHSLPSPLLRRTMLPDDSDNKSHMSELTEDRTQKQFDALQYLREARELRERVADLDAGVASNNAGNGNNNNNNNSNNNASRLFRYASCPSPSSGGRGGPTPPTYILGGDNTTNTGGVNGRFASPLQQQLLQNFHNPENAKLDTINSSATVAGTTPSRLMVGPEHLPRSGRAASPHPPHHVMVEKNTLSNGNGNSTQSLGAGTPGRLTVAQRARLQAERGSITPVRIRLAPDQGKPITNTNTATTNTNIKGPPPTSPPRNRLRPERRPSTSSRSSGGFFANIGRKLEAAIDKSVFSVDVHVNNVDDEDLSSDEEDDRPNGNNNDDDDDDDDASRSSSRDPADQNDNDHDRHTSSSLRKSALLTQASLNGHSYNYNSNKQQQQRDATSSPTNKTRNSPRHCLSVGGTPRRYDSSSSIMSDEKKTPTTPDRMKTMTLQERQALQRAKQLQFLKEQGLIKDEAEVKGGAGVASPSFDTSSVTSTNVSGHGGSIVSFPGTQRFR